MTTKHVLQLAGSSRNGPEETVILGADNVPVYDSNVNQNLTCKLVFIFLRNFILSTVWT